MARAQPGHFRLCIIRSMSMLPLSSPHLLDQVDCGSDKTLQEHEDLKEFKNSLQEQMKFIHRRHLQNQGATRIRTSLVYLFCA